MYKQILAEIVHFLGNLMRFSGKVNRGFVLDMIIFGECMPHPNPSSYICAIWQWDVDKVL